MLLAEPQSAQCLLLHIVASRLGGLFASRHVSFLGMLVQFTFIIELSKLVLADGRRCDIVLLLQDRNRLQQTLFRGNVFAPGDQHGCFLRKPDCLLALAMVLTVKLVRLFHADQGPVAVPYLQPDVRSQSQTDRQPLPVAAFALHLYRRKNISQCCFRLAGSQIQCRQIVHRGAHPLLVLGFQV